MQFLSVETLHRNRWFLGVVVLPVLLSAIYYTFIASPEYVSESHFVVKSPGQRPSSVTSIASLLQTSTMSGGEEQSGEVIDYISSRSALDSLNKNGELAAFYSRPDADFLSRYPHFWRGRTNEGLYRYYKKMVSAELDRENGVVVLKTRGFTADDAQTINRQLLALSEGLINQLNAYARNHEVDEGEARVVLAEQRVQKAREALSAYRNTHDILDPTKQASGALEIAARLISEQAALKAQLQQTERAAPQNPAIPALQARIAAIGAQIAAQNGRAVGVPGAMASKATDYDKLFSEQEFASQNLIAANTGLETARADALRQQFYVERVVAPSLPDWPEFPHRLLNILTLAGGLLCIYFIGWMLVVGILEHAPED